MGIYFNKNKLLSYEKYLEAAKLGSIPAQNNLGRLLENKELQNIGIPYNINEAIKWYEIAAIQGSPYAMYNLGRLYYSNKNDFFKENNLKGIDKFKRKLERLKKAKKWYNETLLSAYKIDYARNQLGKIVDEISLLKDKIKEEKEIEKYQKDIEYIRKFKFPGNHCDRPSIYDYKNGQNWTKRRVQKWERAADKYVKCVQRSWRYNKKKFEELKNEYLYIDENGDKRYKHYLIAFAIEKKQKEAQKLFEDLNSEVDWIDEQGDIIIEQSRKENEQESEYSWGNTLKRINENLKYQNEHMRRYY